MSRTATSDRIVVINDDAVERGEAAAIALAEACLVLSRAQPWHFGREVAS